jgi:hypothetical protein
MAQSETKAGNAVSANFSSSVPSCWIFLIPSELFRKLAHTHCWRRVRDSESESESRQASRQRAVSQVDT